MGRFTMLHIFIFILLYAVFGISCIVLGFSNSQIRLNRELGDILKDIKPEDDQFVGKMQVIDRVMKVSEPPKSFKQFIKRALVDDKKPNRTTKQ